ncbi:MAG: hypothetical protein LBV17_06685 [Treponema sp.]|nr:hypothetical protein [Treponema sp.]
MKIYFLAILAIFFISPCLFPSGSQTKYYIENKSGEDIKLTGIYKDIVKREWGFPYYEDNIQVGVIRVSANTYDINMVIPAISNKSYHYYSIMAVDPVIILEHEDGSRAFKQQVPFMQQIGEAKNIEYVHPPGHIVFHSFLEIFTIYDMDDNVIMTLDDIDENSFEHSKMGDGNFSSTIYMTQERVEAGRKKHAGRAPE